MVDDMLNFGFVAAVAFCLMAFLLVMQSLPCLLAMRRGIQRGNLASGRFTPRARVLLCLRGADPFLDRCLRGLATQDYPDYKVIIIVDSATDESLPQVQTLLGEFGGERIEVVIRDRLWSTCSRKISSLLCGFSRVPAEVEVVAWCDADAIPHSTWLRELTAPLQDAQTAVTTGNRWYAPARWTVGSLCRHSWNAMAFLAMYKNRLPWGGSLAMRSDVFRDPAFPLCLQRSFSDDMALGKFVLDRGQRVEPVVGLAIVNEEACGLMSFWGFLVRQMLALRLNHPCWPILLGEALVLFTLLWVLLPLAISQGVSSWGWWLAGATVYNIIALSSTGSLESLVRRMLAQRGRPAGTAYGWRLALLAYPTLCLTGFVYSLAVVRAAFATTHKWRGIVYRIEGQGVSILNERQPVANLSAAQYEST